MSEDKKAMTVPEKKELQSRSEPTVRGKMYVPTTDIVETDEALMVYMDMPGVNKGNLKIKLEKDILGIDGEIDSTPYQNLDPLYTEYNVGHFSRHFELSNKIDRNGIKAQMQDGVLKLILPKVPESQPRTISIS